MRACWPKTPVFDLGQRIAFTVIVDGVVLHQRFPCSPKAQAGYGDWLRADTDRRWSGTEISGKQETEPTCHCVNDSLFFIGNRLYLEFPKYDLSPNIIIGGITTRRWLWTVTGLPVGMDRPWTAKNDRTSRPQSDHTYLGQVIKRTFDLTTAPWITAQSDDAVTHTAPQPLLRENIYNY